jgi:glycosyltransferase involved in cell wall biosynthesis
MKLSIITINFNNREGLKKTIESVIAQKFTDYEYLIVDGGSTDGSLDVIKQYADSISWWVSEPDEGIYDAMNKGILQAKGDYCQFLNSGDSLYSETVLENVFKENYAEDIVTGNFIEQYANKTVLRKGRVYARQQEGKSLTLFDLFAGSLSHQSTFIRRTLFDRYGLYDVHYKIASDWIFFLKTIGLNNVEVKHIDIIIVYFNMDGISNTELSLSVRERTDILKSLLPSVIFEDYLHFIKMESDFHNINQYKFFYHFARLLNKLATAFLMVESKSRAVCAACGIHLKHKERTF